MRWKTLIICFIIVFLVALAGSIFTNTSVKSAWYESIKPGITPPNFVFPIAWTILFILIAISLYFAWTKSKGRDRNDVALAFGTNFFHNILWCILFFFLKNPFFAFLEIIVLWISIIILLVITFKIDKKSFYLLLPYLIWVSFAGILNYLMT